MTERIIEVEKRSFSKMVLVWGLGLGLLFAVSGMIGAVGLILGMEEAAGQTFSTIWVTFSTFVVVPLILGARIVEELQKMKK